MDVWVVLFFLAFMNYMPTFVYKVWCEHVFISLKYIYLGVEMLGYEITVFNCFKN